MKTEPSEAETTTVNTESLGQAEHEIKADNVDTKQESERKEDEKQPKVEEKEHVENEHVTESAKKRR